MMLSDCDVLLKDPNPLYRIKLCLERPVSVMEIGVHAASFTTSRSEIALLSSCIILRQPIPVQNDIALVLYYI